MIKIVTDTDSNLPQNIAKEYDIEMVPIHIIFGDEVLLEEVELGAAEGYERMAAAKELPKTSQPSPGEFFHAYRKILAGDPDATILSIHVSGGVSGTVASAYQAADMLPEADIHIFDTRSVSLGQGLMAVEAAQMARDGASVKDILATLAMMSEEMQVAFAVKTLDNLAKGGRIGRASYLLASMLEIKPLLKIDDGVLDAHSRHRTWQRALAELQNLVLKDTQAALAGYTDQRLYLAVVHAHNELECRQIADNLTKALRPHTLLIGEVGLGLGIHSGPDALGVCWVVMPGK
ncbi:MAG: DegV family protein [Anaerolineae bacterium]|nr:DegV family protein [Anaerolineae bacterium]